MKTLATLIILSCISLSTSASEYFIFKIDGPDECVQIITSANQKINAELFMSLSPGDKIYVLKEKASVSLISSDDSELTITAGNSPFEVPEKNNQSPSVTSNIMSWIQGWYSSNSTVASKTATLVSRGGEDPVSLMGLTNNDNLILLPVDSVSLFFDAPANGLLSLSLDGKTIGKWNAQGETEMVLPLRGLQQGYYDLTWQTEFDGQAYNSTYVIGLVTEEDLPLTPGKPVMAALGKSLQQRVMAISLMEFSEWRFQSLQLGVQLNDDIIMAAALSGHVRQPFPINK